MQYAVEKNKIILKVKKAHPILRFLFYAMFSIIFLGPIIGFIISINVGKPFHFKYVFGMIASSLLGFYILRYALWNSFGKEIIELRSEKISYITDYKFFRDKKNYIRKDHLTFSYRTIGYIEDQMGCLNIHVGEEIIQSVVKMPILDIENLLKKLTTINKP